MTPTSSFSSSSVWSYWAAYVLFVALAVCLATLRAAYAISGRAGAARLCEKFPAARQRISAWAPRWDVLRVTILTLANLANIASVVCILHLAHYHLAISDGARLALVVLAATFVVILAMNMVPQALSEGYADRISIVFLPLMTFLARLLWPVVWPLCKIESLLRHRILARSDEDDRPTPEESIITLVDSTRDNDLEEEEREMIRSVFEFGETVAREIMIPRIDVEGLEDTLTIGQCARKIISSRYSRYPVFHENLDDIKGVVHVKSILGELCNEQAERIVADVAKPLPFVPESMPINDLLQLLRKEQSQIAIVVDEYGGTAGLITVEDIVEELVGEIQDEYDGLLPESMRRLPDGSILLNARSLVDEVNDQLRLHIPASEEYDSVGGYVIHALGRIPRPGDAVEGTDFQLTVQTANPRQVLTLKLIVRPGETSP